MRAAAPRPHDAVGSERDAVVGAASDLDNLLVRHGLDQPRACRACHVRVGGELTKIVAPKSVYYSVRAMCACGAPSPSDVSTSVCCNPADTCATRRDSSAAA